MTLDKEKIKSEYLGALKFAYESIETMTPAYRKFFVDNVTKPYYLYLIEKGIIYGKLALEVLENKGKYGEYANRHLHAQSVFNGIPETELTNMREKLIISLSYRDADMRTKPEYEVGKSFASQIEDYHIEEFSKHSTPYAWGGLIMRESIGSGSWLESYERDEGFLAPTLKLIGSKMGADLNRGAVESKSYSLDRLYQSAIHAFSNFDTPFHLSLVSKSPEKDAKAMNIDLSKMQISEERPSIALMNPFPEFTTYLITPKPKEISEESEEDEDSGDCVPIIETDLMRCLHNHDISMAEKLILETKVDVNEPASDNTRAIHVAAEEGLDSMIKLLLISNAEIDAPDDMHMTPLHHAAFNAEIEAAEILLSKGADTKILDDLGKSALHYACGMGPQEMVDLLVSHGFDMHLKDKSGETPNDVLSNIQKQMHGQMEALGQDT